MQNKLIDVNKIFNNTLANEKNKNLMIYIDDMENHIE